ncbi:MAG: PIN domain-containing protein [Burkholderiales bacterium]|nr:PIN domain-containing protein [Burkholderiales bacterium]
MTAEAFIDTNVFIYHLDATDKRKHRIAEGIVRDALASGNACISWQVVQECLNAALRKAAVPLKPEQARSYLDVVLLPLSQMAPSAAVYHRALEVQQRWRFSFFDSLIVASALAAGCRRLLTEDLQHGQRIETLTVQNPFLE